ncbi:outer membrane protein [Desulfosediminicola sp.]|uniref:outer membrane protein n=1 Tax=Desulfosediminicola sp. TaxID=2886825 RepID=UPI003AF2AF4C
MYRGHEKPEYGDREMRIRFLNLSFVVAFCCCFSFLFNSTVQAGEWYVSGHAGAVFPDDAKFTTSLWPVESSIEFDTGLGIFLAAGYDFGIFRAEGELGYQKNSFDRLDYAQAWTSSLSGDQEVTSLMINSYFEFDNSTNFTPYLTLGMGVAYVEWDDLDVHHVPDSIMNFSDTVFAYQFGIGLEYAISTNFALDLRYRYFGTRDIDITDYTTWWEAETDIGNQMLCLGLRYSF